MVYFKFCELKYNLNMEDVLESLRELNIEDKIWITYFFLAGFAIYSNHLERISVLNQDRNARLQYKTINITLLSIGFFIYLYFFVLAYKHLKELSPNASPRQILTGNTQFLATVFLLTGSILILLTEILKEN